MSHNPAYPAAEGDPAYLVTFLDYPVIINLFCNITADYPVTINLLCNIIAR
jgi:hypothetical protein